MLRDALHITPRLLEPDELHKEIAILTGSRPPARDADKPPLGFADDKVVVSAGTVALVSEFALELQQVVLHVENENAFKK